MLELQKVPTPDFRDSKDLRVYCNDVRRACHAIGMAMHIGAAEIEAALTTIQPAGGVWQRATARRRARRVSRHMKHAAELMITSGAAATRTWGAFKAEYDDELSGIRGKRAAFKVVPE